MKSKLLESIRLYRNDDLHASARVLNEHFEQRFGEFLFKDFDISEVASSNTDWEAFAFNLMDKFWNGKLPIGVFYRELWMGIPSIMMPFWISQTNFLHFGFKSWEDQEAYNILKLGDLVDLLEEACRQGLILDSYHPVLDSIFPVIGEDFYEGLWEQVNDVLEVRLAAAARNGLAQCKVKDIKELANLHPGFITQRIFIQLFLSQEAYYHGSVERIPSLSISLRPHFPWISQALQNHAASLSDQDLGDFIFDYTCGKAQPTSPRAWMDAFIKSLGTGEVLFTLE